MHVSGLLHVSRHEQQQVFQFMVVLLGVDLYRLVYGLDGLLVAFHVFSVVEQKGCVVVPSCG